MDNEPYYDLTHHQARDLWAAGRRERGWLVRTEFKLPDDRIADVVALDPCDDIYIFEVKSFYADHLAQAAFEKYHRWSNYLFMVVPHLSVEAWRCQERSLGFATNTARVGVISLSRDHDQVLHPPAFHALIGEHRLRIMQDLYRPDR